MELLELVTANPALLVYSAPLWPLVAVLLVRLLAGPELVSEAERLLPPPPAEEVPQPIVPAAAEAPAVAPAPEVAPPPPEPTGSSRRGCCIAVVVVLLVAIVGCFGACYLAVRNAGNLMAFGMEQQRPELEKLVDPSVDAETSEGLR